MGSDRHTIGRRSLIKSSVALGAGAALSGSALIGVRAQSATPVASFGVAKNVIFAMGDGMGQAHLDFARLLTVGPYERLAIETLPATGLSGTNAVTRDTYALITDSAAAATAMATGHKTYNGAIGVDIDGNTVTNIVELAKAAGKSIGIATTADVPGASSAAFTSHIDDRDKKSEIAAQLIADGKVDVILGGGEDYFLPAGTEGVFPDNADLEEASEGTQGDLIAAAETAGYTVVRNPADLAAAQGPLVLGLFANQSLYKEEPENIDDVFTTGVSLSDLVAKAIEILSQNPNGFFLFIEEDGIDEYSHEWMAEYTVRAVQELDNAVATALDFATTDGETLLVVTADHECGGLTIIDVLDAIEDEDYERPANSEGPFRAFGTGYQFLINWATPEHSGVRVPVKAFGPGSELFYGDYENTQLFVKMVQAFGFELPAGAGETPIPGVTPDEVPSATPVN